jgi:hypothetical protein
MFYLFKNPKTPEELARICKNPKRLASWLVHRIRYVSDEKKHGYDKWQTPLKTLWDRTGDCDDVSLLAKAALECLGFKSFLLGVFAWKGTDRYDMVGHLVCVFYWRGRYWHVSNWGLKPSVKTTEEDAITEKIYNKIATTVHKDAKIWRLFNENKTELKKGVHTVSDGWVPSS